MHELKTLRAGAVLSLILATFGCGKPAPKPSQADITGYLAQSFPAYLRVGGVSSTFEPLTQMGAAALPPGSWRVDVHFTLHAEQDLFGPTPESRAQRAAFDRTVAAVEAYRLPRIAAVAQLGQQAGLVAPGASAPEPAMEVRVISHKGQDLADGVVLLAQPDGKSWKFVQLNAQTLGDDDIGAPLDELKRGSPGTIFVATGSPEAHDYTTRERRFMDVLSKAPKPQ